MLGEVFERFVEKSPHLRHGARCPGAFLGADRLDVWFERTAQKPYTRDLLFSSVYDLMNQVVFCVNLRCVPPTRPNKTTWAPPWSRSITSSTTSKRIRRRNWCGIALVGLPLLSRTWAVSGLRGSRAIASKSSMATASKPVSIVSRNCARPRGGLCPANHWWCMSPPRAW